jgi:glycogen phosphorylase
LIANSTSSEQAIAYFSMEIALKPEIPTYSGGLGVLAGDTIRAAADRDLPMVAVTLLYREGYFYQRLDASGWQSEQPAEWVPEDFLDELPERATVTIEDRVVHLRAWRYGLKGVTGGVVPVYLLDTDLEENTDRDRTLTDSLYGGDSHYRLCQVYAGDASSLRRLQSPRAMTAFRWKW